MTDTSPATATPAAAGPAEVRHDRRADVIIAGPDQPWAYGAHQARMLVTGVPAGRTCAGLTAGPGTRIDDHGTAGRYSTADFTVAWDTLAACGWQLRAAPAATDPALPARIRNQLRLTQTSCYAPADPAAGLATAAGGRHLARRHPDRYVSHAALDPDLRDLLTRTQAAAAALAGSPAAAADAADADSSQWAIARTLAGLSRLRRQHQPDGEAAADTAAAIEEITRSVTTRIQALETWAARAAGADAARAARDRALQPPGTSPAAPARPPSPKAVVLFCTLCLLILVNAPALMFPGAPVNAAAAIIGNTFVLLLGAGAYTLAAAITRPDPVPATEADADPDAAAAAAAAAELLASAAADRHDIATLTHHASQAAQTEVAIHATTPAQLAGDPS